MKIWCLDYRDRVYTDAAMRDVTRFRGLDPISGMLLAERFPTDATVEVRTKRAPNDYFKAGIFWFVSSKLRDILDSYRIAAEYLSVRMVRKRGEAISGNWYCFNPILVLDWFDRANSKFTLEKTFATEIESVVVDMGVFGEAPLSVAANTIPELVGVRDDVAESILSAGCTGAVFREPAEWRNPVNPIV